MVILQILYIMFLDYAILSVLKEIVYSFLLSKRNVKTAKKIHLQQSKKKRFTLSYIADYTIYPKQFQRFYKVRLCYIYIFVPQIILFTVLTILDIFWLVLLVYGLKCSIILVVGLVFYRGRFTVYDRRSNKKRNH